MSRQGDLFPEPLAPFQLHVDNLAFHLGDTFVGKAGPLERVGETAYIEGYNIKIGRGGLKDEWTHLGGGPAHRFAYYKVFKPGDELERRAGKYPKALFLDYRQGDPPNGLFTGKGLRDYVVKISDDLIIGRALFTLGPLTVDGGVFVTERWRKADFAPPASTQATARAA